MLYLTLFGMYLYVLINLQLRKVRHKENECHGTFYTVTSGWGGSAKWVLVLLFLSLSLPEQLNVYDSQTT